jgi:hypothetical protein
MPKISEFGGPTDESQPGYYMKGRSEQSPNVVVTDPEVVGEEQAAQDRDEDREGDDVSPGTNSSKSGDKTVKNEQNEKPVRRSSAPVTDTPSKSGTGNSTARSTGGSGKAAN